MKYVFVSFDLNFLLFIFIKNMFWLNFFVKNASMNWRSVLKIKILVFSFIVITVIFLFKLLRTISLDKGS